MSGRSRERKNRVVAMIASLALVVGLVPVPALAAAGPGEPPVDSSPAAVPAAEPAATPVEESSKAAAPVEEESEAAAPAEEESKAAIPVEEPSKAAAPAEELSKAAAPVEEKSQAAALVEGESEAKAPAEESSKAATPAEETGKAPAAEYPAFKQNAMVGGVTVTVEAGAGAFPEGARLSVTAVSSSATEAAVAPERGAGESVAASYTFDIKVLEKDGEEVQPANGKSVKVSFAAAEVADPNLDLSVYHVSGGEAEELSVSESGSTATAQSTGFSYYTVEFTYGELQYVLQGGESVPLADVLATVGLQGVPTAAESSAPELFSVARDENGVWKVSAKQAFTSAETLIVTINGQNYEIAVTDEQSGTCGGNLTWILDGGTLAISGTGDMYNYWHNRPSWFDYREGITAVIIGEGVTSIGELAFFDCTSLTSVEIPSSVTSIEGSAFESCTSLTSVEIPDGVTEIGGSAFLECTCLTSVSIPDGVTEIRFSAFESCTSLTSVEIPDGVTEIGDWAFDSCSSLTSVEIPSSVTSIRKGAFSSCSSLTSVEIPSSVTEIGSSAFHSCTSLTSVIIASGETSVAEDAFCDCEILEDVYYGGTPEQWVLVSNAFANNPTVHFACGDGVYYTLDEGVLTISKVGDGTGKMDDFESGNAPWYSSCDNIKAVVIGDGVTSIGEAAFLGCTNLGSVTIPDSVTSIGSGAFSTCSSLTSVTVPKSVTSIGNAAFYSCDKLEHIFVDNLKKSLQSTEPWHESATTVHWRRMVATKVIPEAGGTIENITVAGVGPYWDIEPGATDPTRITVEATPNPGFFLSKVTYEAEGSTEETDITSEKSFNMPNEDVTVTAYFEPKTKITITAGSGEWTYDGGKHANTSVTVTGGELPDGDELEASATGSVTNVADTKEDNNLVAEGYRVMRGTEDVTGEYDITAVAGTLTIKPAPLTITAIDQTYNYNGQTQGEGDTVYEDAAEIADKVKVEGLQGNDTLTSITLDGQGEDVGEYELVPSNAAIGGSADNYAITYVNGTLTIEPAPVQEYTVTFANWDGTVLQSGKVAAGQLPKYEGDEPTRPETDQYLYVFQGWTPEVVAVTGDATYTAVFEPVLRTYDVIWLNDDGTELYRDVHVSYGQMPDYDGPTPTKPSDEKYTYTFSGWTPEVVAVTGDATYTATYAATPIPPKPTEEYTVTFANWDGTVLQSGKIAEGELPKYEGDEPTKPADDKYTYTFSGWTPEVVAVTGDATYTATYAATPKDKPVYKVVSGAGGSWTAGSGEPMVFKIERTIDPETAFSHFIGIDVDGKALPEKDASGKANWTARSGSVIVELQPAYLGTLSEGKHTLTALFDDGDPVTAEFKVAAKASPSPDKPAKGTSPKTGDPLAGAFVVTIATAIIALIAMVAFAVRRRRA